MRRVLGFTCSLHTLRNPDSFPAFISMCGWSPVYSFTSNELSLDFKNKHFKSKPYHATLLSSSWGNTTLLSSWVALSVTDFHTDSQTKTPFIFYFFQIPVDHQTLMILLLKCLTNLVPPIHFFAKGKHFIKNKKKSSNWLPFLQSLPL